METIAKPEEVNFIRMPIGDIIMRRIIKELVLVGVLEQISRDGKPTPLPTVLKELNIFIQAEREYIKNNPKRAVKTYACLYNGDEMTAKEVIEYITVADYDGHYRKLIAGSNG